MGVDPFQFQFHYGSVKRKQKIILLKQQGNFNSTMVRLKEEKVDFKKINAAYFNSTMVRLKDTHPLLSRLLSLISIPLWFG